MAVAAVAVREKQNDLRKGLCVDRSHIKAFSGFNTDEKMRVNEWLEDNAPFDTICDRTEASFLSQSAVSISSSAKTQADAIQAEVLLNFFLFVS